MFSLLGSGSPSRLTFVPRETLDGTAATLPAVGSPPWRPTRLSIASWAGYDLANTIFALGVGSLYFPEWLNDHRGELPGWITGRDSVDLALALAINLAMVVVILLAPWIGARSDHRGRRVRFLIPATVVAVVPTFFLASATVGASLMLFALALVGFNLGGVVYDALLPDVSTPETIGRVSGWGIGVGYIGSFIAVGVGAVLLDSASDLEVAAAFGSSVGALAATGSFDPIVLGSGHAAVFRTIAVLFAVFALPAFLWIRERPRKPGPGPAPSPLQGLRRLKEAWRSAKAYRGVTRFLIGRFLYTDAINTLIGGFLTIYAIEELGLSDGEVQALLAIAILGAIIGGIGGGRVVDRIGPRVLLNAVLYTWMVAMGIGIVAGVADIGDLAWPLGVLGGLALGATWAADRVYMQRISPPRRLGEFYGLYATVGRFATILGPLVWGVIVTILGLPREVALSALVVFLIAGRVVVGGVDDRPREWSADDLAPL